MRETSSRLLKLLTLLQSPRDWSGTELAERLEVDPRTVRRDVERLRRLGYPVHAVRGIAGYRLGAGASLPPLLLDDDEAVAVVVGLRTAASGSVAGIEESSLRALSKLERMLPSRLRYRVRTLNDATVRAGVPPGPSVPAETLMAIADATRRHEQLRFDYLDARGEPSRRSVEPHRLVSFGRTWYLVAFDDDRRDWRIFRVDRLTLRTPNGPRFAPRELPYGDVATYVADQLSARAWPYQATITLHASAATVADMVWPGMGVLEPVDEHSCRLHLGATEPTDLAWMVTSVGVDFTLTSGPPELAEALRAQATRCLRALPPVPPAAGAIGGSSE